MPKVKNSPSPWRRPNGKTLIGVAITAWVIVQGCLLKLGTRRGALDMTPTIKQSQDFLQPRVVSRNDELLLLWDKVSSSYQNRDLNNGTGSPVIVFYHIYIPYCNSTDTGSVPVEQIIQEQLDQVMNSFVAQKSKHFGGPLWLLYNTIGLWSSFLVQEIIPKLCQSKQVQCQHVRHFGPGNYEDVTLDMVHSFCHRQSHSSGARVVYLHNKGSHHSRNGTNHVWRRALTASATSQDCVTATENGRCDLCGLFWQTVPFPHVPGNMWIADCQYIRGLLPLPDFGRKMTSVQNKWRTLLQQGLLTRGIYSSTEDWTLGDGRYVWEHWIGSHPDVRACDVSPTDDMAYWKTANTTTVNYTAVFAWQNAPRVPLLNQHWKLKPRPNKTVLVHSPQNRQRDIHLLPGLLIKYVELYHKWPALSSWIWSHFPDADAYRQWFETNPKLAPTTENVLVAITEVST
ncbi:hypothetical protein ACA910_000820 [Epithemia clementina (nom. ined.)]